jgi:hypothetical protein
MARTKCDMLSARDCIRRKRVTYMLRPEGGGAGISARCLRLAPGAAKATEARTRSETIVLNIFVGSVKYSIHCAQRLLYAHGEIGKYICHQDRAARTDNT